MNEVTKYAADDGTVFDSADEALAYEQLLQQLAEVDALLRPVPIGCDFANGFGFVQQQESMVERYKNALMLTTERVCELGTDNPWLIERRLDDTQESSAKAIRTRWYRLRCIDELHREWGQPFFARHPEEGKQVEVGNAD